MLPHTSPHRPQGNLAAHSLSSHPSDALGQQQQQGADAGDGAHGPSLRALSVSLRALASLDKQPPQNPGLQATRSIGASRRSLSRRSSMHGVDAPPPAEKVSVIRVIAASREHEPSLPLDCDNRAPPLTHHKLSHPTLQDIDYIIHRCASQPEARSVAGRPRRLAACGRERSQPPRRVRRRRRWGTRWSSEREEVLQRRMMGGGRLPNGLSPRTLERVQDTEHSAWNAEFNRSQEKLERFGLPVPQQKNRLRQELLQASESS